MTNLSAVSSPTSISETAVEIIPVEGAVSGHAVFKTSRLVALFTGPQAGLNAYRFASDTYGEAKSGAPRRLALEELSAFLTGA